AYDLVRFLISVSLRGEDHHDLIRPTLVESLRRGYIQGVLCPELGYEQMLHLRVKEPKRWQTSTRAYLEANRLWAAKLRLHATSPHSKKMVALLSSYLDSRGEQDLLSRYEPTEGARVPGSLGKVHKLILLHARRKGDD